LLASLTEAMAESSYSLMSIDPKNLPSEWIDDFLIREMLLMLIAGTGNLS
jgi:hypothetical protein